jgi:hypothetical protein
MMKINSQFWIRVILLNLFLVALFGTLMRYKIGFPFPLFQQKFLQEAHSHFAFSGWISQTLFFLIIQLFRSNLPHIREKAYHTLLLGNLVCAYGMLVSFAMQGYGPVSITFASASLIIGYIFSVYAYRDANRLEAGHPAKNWIKAAIFFGVLSTAGTIVLSHMMATKQYDQTLYLSSIYFYLHFQYNGWFLFAGFAIFLDRIRSMHLEVHTARFIFWSFFLAGIPAFFLSTLWAKIPAWLYGLVILAAILQTAGWWVFAKTMWGKKVFIRSVFGKTVSWLLLIVALAVTVKLLLQLVSTVPIISKLAFGFRPIVIAYLHLVLLLILSVFLLSILYSMGYMRKSKLATAGLIFFVSGAILNEVVLATEGIAAFSYTVIPGVHTILFGVALLIFSGSAMLVASQLRFAKR